MKRIIVGVGESGAGRHGFDWAVGLAAGTGAEVVVVSAFGPTSPSSLARADELGAIRRNEIDSWLGPLSGSGVDTSVRTVLGDPRVVLLDEATRLEADLIVVGREGPRGEPGLLRLGSVVEYLAHHVTIPLAVITADAPNTPRTIVLGVDGSTNGCAAAHWVADIAPTCHPRVVALLVHEPFLEWTPPPDPTVWRRDTEAEIRNDLAIEPARAGASVEPFALRGRPPTDGLLDTASRKGADLIVVGTRGAGGFFDLRLGGTALGVLHRAECSVVLVPPSYRRYPAGHDGTKMTIADAS